MKMHILIIISLILLVGCTNTEKLVIDGNQINIEIADTSEERAKGLMFRESLDYNSGMLFIYDNEDYRSFWMKNTLIPLDLMFIDENLIIVDIKENFQPCKGDPCDVYTSKGKAKYVLEVNANYSKDKGIKVGDKVGF